MNIGDRVIAGCDVYEGPTGDTPGGYCCRRGDLLIVRSFGTFYPYYVSHEGREGESFGVEIGEIRPENPASIGEPGLESNS